MTTSALTQRRFLSVVLVACLAVAQVHAQQIPGYPLTVRGYDPRELALLPPYCKYTQEFEEKVPGGADKVEKAKWQATIGAADFNALHHYCWGLMNANRAMFLARTEEVKKFYLGEALREYAYVFEHTRPELPLLPEIHARKGDALLRLGQIPDGLAAIEHAVGLKPDYWLPYAYASDHFKRAGDVARARNWLEKGLAAAPESPALKSRVESLGSASAKRP
jgi:tetratricopeptide (TPR) repeat protein